MPENTEVIVDDGAGQPGGEQEQVPPQQVAPPAQPPAPQQTIQRTVVVPTAAMKRIKDEEFSRGKSAALEELAKSYGYASNADLQAALQQQAQARQQAQQPAQQTPPEADPAEELAAAKEARREEGKYQRQLEKVLNERNRYAQSATDWRKQADAAKAETDAVKAEMYLRTVAAGSGIQDIDYAIVLFSREVEKMTPEEAEQFDERAWFAGLRASKPLLFGEAVVPATTGTGAGGAPKPPAPNQVQQQNGKDGRTDARKMNPAEYRAELARRGINPGV